MTDAEGTLTEEHCTVAIVGGGTSGLALAAELMRLSVGKVIVLERENQAGGIPRHCGHYPFGVREYKKLLKGPDYARNNRDNAIELGVDIRTNTTVTELRPNGVLDISTNLRQYRINANRVVLCTGVRESSRSQRFIGGQRPTGIISTGALQSMVYLKGIKPFQRPVILGSELVSFSAIQTCEHLGIKPVAMIEEQSRIIVRSLMRPYLMLKNVPLHTSATNPRIIGDTRVEAVEFTDKNGAIQRVESDGVIVSGHFRPESALLHLSHLDVDPNSGGPVVDQFGRCSDPAYFCTGNLLRPAETSSFCWHEGVATAKRLAADITNGSATAHDSIPIKITDTAIRFVVPQRLSLTDSEGGVDQLYLGLNQAVNTGITLSGDGHTLWQGKLNSRPVRRIQIPLPKIDSSKPPTAIEVSLNEKER